MNATASPMTIDVESLKKTYPGGVEAVKGIDFDVAAGEVFGLLGPNGAGKSTTIGMLTTTIVPTSGTARLAGFDVARDPIAARGVASVVFQEAVVDAGLSGRANLKLHARLWGVGGRRPTTGARSSCRRLGSRSWSTARSAATAAANAADSKSHVRSYHVRRCCS